MNDQPLDVDALMQDLRRRAAESTPSSAAFPVPPGQHEVRLTPIIPASSRPVVGGAITAGRRAAVRAVLPTLDNLAEQVTAALESVTRVEQQVQALQESIDEGALAGRAVEDLDARLSTLTNLGLAQRVARIEAQLAQIDTQGPIASDVHDPAAAPRIDASVAALAIERARLDVPIDDRMQAYWPMLPDDGRVLDLSTEASAASDLAKRGFAVHSVGMDSTSVAQRSAAGADAEIGDPLDALARCSGEGLSGIVAIGLGDYLAPDQWLAFAPMARDALRDGGGLVLEMLNCTTPASQATRARLPDLPPATHPESIAFLLRAAGFRDVEIRNVGSFPADQQIPITNDPDWFEARLNEIAQVINRLVVGQPLVAILARR